MLTIIEIIILREKLCELLLLSTLHILAYLIPTRPYQVYNVILIGQMRQTIALSHVVRETPGWGSAPVG